MKKLILGAAALLMSFAVFAEDAEEIMKKSTTQEPPYYSKAIVFMDLIDKNGKVEDHRIVEQIGNHKNELVQTTFNFKESTTVKGTRFLQAEKANKTDDKWIFMPSLGTVRRVNLTDRKKSFLNSDCTYNDMTLRSYEFDGHEMLEEDCSVTVAGKTYKCWKIKSTPETNKDVEYSYRESYIDKNSYLPVKTDMFNKAGINFKTVTIDELEQVTGVTGKKYWLRKKHTFQDNRTGHKTIIDVQKIEFDKEVPDRVFTQNWLMTGK